ncbi:MAG: 16S rRNA (uracil(1498)-N(3))-methyltransferase [Bacteroidaceae bacterium]|nr:16S rRNA (uracil(1498)-N(3))-methyltransferase [Bacteroidaceae bacterium]
MKEQRFFYNPQPESGQLPPEEAAHALRVLRLSMGDEIFLMDGRGVFHRAVITEAGGHHCRYRIEESLPQQPEWQGLIHLAVAPTKNMDRMEWLAEKATEVGLDELSLLECRFSERRVVKPERLDKILVAAMKQSHKAWRPQLNPLTPFQQFIARTDLPQQRFIAHCYEEVGDKPFLLDVLQPRTPALVLIGPEGDFSVDEVHAAEAAGFRSVSLGTSRLRTETAALVAVHLMRLANR